MSNGWDQSKEAADKHSASGPYVRLANDGDKLVGIFVGDPNPREVIWTGDKYVDAATTDGEKLVADGKKPSLRVGINLFVIAEQIGSDKKVEVREMKILEMNATTFKDLLKIREKYGLEKWSFEIQRSGAAGDPKTTYSILPEDKLGKSDHKEIEKHELHDLTKVGTGEASGSDDFDSYDKKRGDEPISKDVTAKLMPRLKALPHEMLDKFLEKFGVKRVKELKAEDEKSAFEFLDELEGKGSSDEVDPFA